MLGQSLRIKKKGEYPSPGTQTQGVSNYYFAFFFLSSWSFGKVLMWGGGGGAQQFNASLSQPNVQKTAEPL